MKKSGRKQGSSPVVRRGIPTAVQLGVLAILACVAYSNSLHGDFVFDDQQIVLQNPALSNIKTLGDVFAVGAGWRQLLFLTYGLNFYWGGLASTGYHVVNLGLHIINVILVYFIIRRLAPSTPFPAFTGAAVFAVHPLMSGAVSYIAGRSSVLCAVFYFGAILFFLKGGKWIALAAVSGFLAWQAKQEAITLPLLLAGIVWLRSEKKDWRVVGALAVIPLIAVILMREQLATLYASVAGNRILVTAGFEQVLAPALYFRTYLTSIVGYYLPRFVFPASLNADPHIQSVAQWYSPEFLFSVFVLAGLTFLVFRFARTEPLLALGITAILLSPLSAYAVIPLADVVLEHRAYIPGLGAALVFAWAFERYRHRMTWITPAVIIVMFTAMTISRNRVYASNISLWEDVVAKSPDKPRARFNLGAAYQNAKRNAEAIPEYERALALKPDIFAAYSNMAALQLDSGQLDEGEKTLLRVTSLAPDYTEGFINLAVLYLRRQQTDKAIAAAEHALRTNSESFAAEYNLGEALTQKGDFANAVLHYKRAVYLRPDLIAFRLTLGAAYSRAGDRASAEKEFLSLANTEFAGDAYRNLGNVYSADGEYDKAVEYLTQSLRLKPANPDAHHDLGIVHLRRQQYAPAIAEFQMTLQQQPGHGPGTLNLALAYQLSGDNANARRTLEQFLREYGASNSPYIGQAQQRLNALP